MADRLSHADRLFGGERVVEACRTRRQQQNRCRSHVEAAHFSAARKADALARQSRPIGRDAYGGTSTPRQTVSMPDTSIAPTSTTANGPSAPRKWRTEALVARERFAALPGDREGRDAEQATGNMHGLDEFAGERHVHAVVVARREIDGGEAAVGVRPCGVLVAEQFGGAEGLALGLEKTRPFSMRPAWLIRPSAGQRIAGGSSATAVRRA